MEVAGVEGRKGWIIISALEAEEEKHKAWERFCRIQFGETIPL
jgi:hypothetical protein